MPFLTGNVKVEEDADINMKRLLEDVIYQDHNGVVFTIPAGYVTDYASVPRALSWIYPKDDPYRKAAIVHDYLITNGLVLKEFKIESHRVDEIFREAMEDTGDIILYLYITITKASKNQRSKDITGLILI
jgi:hypothetical protein